MYAHTHLPTNLSTYVKCLNGRTDVQTDIHACVRSHTCIHTVMCACGKRGRGSTGKEHGRPCKLFG